MAAKLAANAAFRGCMLTSASRADEDRLFALHRDAMHDYVDATWGWDEAWQRDFFARTYAPGRHALIVRGEALAGRICLTRHWQRLFLRDIELVAAERNRRLGTAIIRAVLELASSERRAVELVVLKCNPAQRLYARLGFAVIADDGARITMRA
ncbi:MAG TPA: GNAT family N-acetyltransferase [Casimicrobiaceae bacterium]|nr:GNAT family N-acetyltransferase [Casimicrobiaceae bacterium]